MLVRDGSTESSEMIDALLREVEGSRSEPAEAGTLEEVSEAEYSKTDCKERLSQQILRSRTSLGSTFIQSQLSSKLAQRVGTEQVARGNGTLSSAGLHRGDIGSEVTGLQRKLVALHYYLDGKIDGIFGPRTEAAVRQFQTDYGIRPTGVVTAETEAAIDATLAKTYDGRRPAAGTTDTNAARPLYAPITNDAFHRSAENYANVINQFAVANNPRYAHRNGHTYCNIFAWDVTRAMGVEIPHWTDSAGNRTPYGVGHELDANAVARWLVAHGAQHGWHQVSAREAQNRANQGFPTVFSWNNPGHTGHVGIVRPGTFTDLGPEIAQAGAINTNDTHIGHIFYDINTPTYWVNDRATSG